jgi:hypothetical protein
LAVVTNKLQKTGSCLVTKDSTQQIKASTLATRRHTLVKKRGVCRKERARCPKSEYTGGKDVHNSKRKLLLNVFLKGGMKKKKKRLRVFMGPKL